MKQPNLFSYATSELSQDAFICWLLSWASPDCKVIDVNLYRCGIELITAFFNKHTKKLPSVITKVEVRKQDSYIDILCIINDEFAIIIEDKTRTKEDNNPLVDYISTIEKRNYEKDNILPIYFKTYDQSNYKSVESQGYKVFSRFDFLSILNKGNGFGITNSIFQDFRVHLQSIENRVQSYQALPVSQWHPQSWVGFYIRLQKELGQGNWSKLKPSPNSKEEFMGFWWGFQGDEKCEQYLLLKEKRLVFKIKVKDITEQKKLRSKWYQLLKSKPSDGFKVKKPKRFGKGTYMTVLEAAEEYMETKDGFIDVDKTIARLRKAEYLLKAVTI